MNERLPCPFCGGTPMYTEIGRFVYIECTDCGVSTTTYLEETSAWECWNRRTDNEE